MWRGERPHIWHQAGQLFVACLRYGVFKLETLKHDSAAKKCSKATGLGLKVCLNKKGKLFPKAGVSNALLFTYLLLFVLPLARGRGLCCPGGKVRS